MFFEKFVKGNFKLLKDAIDDGYKTSVFGLNIGQKLAILEDCEFLFYIVDEIKNANFLLDNFIDLGRKPAIISSPIDVLSSQFESSEKILETLHKVKKGEIDTLIITPQILATKFPKPESLESINLKIGDSISISTLISKLVELNYKRVDMVSQKGEFAVRGDIVDIYSLGDNPIRISTDYDNIESIRVFSPITMLATKDITSTTIESVKYYNVTEKDIENFYKLHSLKKDNDYYDFVASIESPINYALMAFDTKICVSIFDYAKNGVIAFDGAKGIYDELSMYITSFNERLSDSKSKIFEKLDIKKVLKFENSHPMVAYHFIQQSNRLFNPEKVFNIRTLPSINYTGHTSVLVMDTLSYFRQNYTILLCVGSNEQAVVLKSELERNGVSPKIFTRVALAEKNGINIVIRKYPLDVILPEEKLAVISYVSIYSRPKKIISAPEVFDGDIPKEGDYVVHNFHGVGRCLGVKTLTLSSAPRDYVVIEYRNNDKVYLPVENINQLTKFIGSEKEPKLNKIGGVEFASTKEKVKNAVKKIAFDLIALYRDRMNKKGMKFLPDDQMQKDFENSFGFDETADQLKCIADCKSDMESGKVMDRLICGDVGFGKTEVALRIAFKTILAGKQVALLCPTTILSEQHFNTAVARMSNFGVKVDVLNRLRSTSDENRIKKEFSEGKIDLLCGTHKLLSKDINYKNLGLLILDEEQKFGVSDKEKIKTFKKHVNVLTLSATPIPRTLNMSLIGVRDISVIETPPTERINTEVEVIGYSDNLLKSVVERELERGGQALIIYNRVETIYKFADKCRFLLPKATISVAHGKLEKDELEKEIFNLYSKKTQVLVATTLIENGVDLPSANTLVVIDSDMLGLSQLYQLKGRIGRSDKSSFAYFTFDDKKLLTENAYKRLEAIKEFSSMGSGFKIAMRDLEIRGAGNILGAEQSGHIEKVGYNMYVKLLSESVSELKGEKIVEKNDVRVETSLPAYLSTDYVQSSARRMSMYKEISNLSTTSDYEKFLSNTESVFGVVPVSLVNLCKIALIKNRLGTLGANRVSISNTAKIYFTDRADINENIAKLVANGEIELSMANEPIVEISKKSDNILDDILAILQKIGTF